MIHRIAIDDRYKGQQLAGQLINHACTLGKAIGLTNLRIDTHEDNQSMQACVKKNGFVYCGVIYLKDGTKRYAYERKI